MSRRKGTGSGIARNRRPARGGGRRQRPNRRRLKVEKHQRVSQLAARALQREVWEVKRQDHGGSRGKEGSRCEAGCEDRRSYNALVFLCGWCTTFILCVFLLAPVWSKISHTVGLSCDCCARCRGDPAARYLCVVLAPREHCLKVGMLAQEQGLLGLPEIPDDMQSVVEEEESVIRSDSSAVPGQIPPTMLPLPPLPGQGPHGHEAYSIATPPPGGGSDGDDGAGDGGRTPMSQVLHRLSLAAHVHKNSEHDR